MIRVLLLAVILTGTVGSAVAADWSDPPSDPERPQERTTRYVPPFRPVWYLGGGTSSAAIDSDYEAIGSQRAGGYVVLGGCEFARTWAGEIFFSGGHKITTGTTANIYYPPDQAEYGVVVFGLHKGLWSLDEHRWTPWLGVGLGIGQVMWENYFYDLTGNFSLAWSGGADIALGSTPLAVRLQVLRHSFSARDNYDYGPYRVEGTITSAALIWRIR